MERDLRNIFTIKNPMPPLWMRYPHIHQFSIGWRMGYGESYKYIFFDWLNNLPANEKKKYEEMFPAPKTWREYYNEEYNFDDIDEYEYKTVELWNKNGAMQYSRVLLMDQIKNGYKPDFIFFHESGEHLQNISCLNPWEHTVFEQDIDQYWCLGQYIAAEKARFFEDSEAEEQIMQSSHRSEIELSEKQIQNFIGEEWNKVIYSVLLNGNYLKFAQNTDIRNRLLDTKDKVLVYAASAYITNPEDWQNDNLYGFALMEVRDDIRNVYKNYDKIEIPGLL